MVVHGAGWILAGLGAMAATWTLATPPVLLVFGVAVAIGLADLLRGYCRLGQSAPSA